MATKTINTEAITASEILELVEKLSPSDLQWLTAQLMRLSDNNRERDSQHLQSNIPPSPEAIAQLDEAVDRHDGPSYHRLINLIDWTQASADVLDKAIGLAIHFGDMKRGKELTELGLKRFPQHEQIARTSILFHPRPSRVTQTAWRPPKNWFKDSMEWIKRHVDEYEIGHWLAVRPGELVADAPTRDELDKKLALLGEDRKPALIYKVIP